MGFAPFWLAHPSDHASYTLRVPQTRVLLTASFRFHLTMNTLAVQLKVPVTTALEETYTLQVTSRFAFAPRLTAPAMAQRAMPGAPKKTMFLFETPFFNNANVENLSIFN